MKVLYKENSLSMLKAVLYAEFTGSEVVANKNFSPALFSEPIIEADDLDITELIIKTRLSKKRPLLFSNPKNLKALEELISWGLRYKHAKQRNVIIKVIQQALAENCLYVLQGRSKESKQLISWSNEVKGEVRLSGHQMKFHLLPNSKNILFSKYVLKHNTHDLVLQQWARIYPEYNFLLLLPGRTVLGNRFIIKEFPAYRGDLAALGTKITSSRLLSSPQRSNLISHHVRYVHDLGRSYLRASHKKAVNYVDFYNKIKKRGNLL